MQELEFGQETPPSDGFCNPVGGKDSMVQPGGLFEAVAAVVRIIKVTPAPTTTVSATVTAEMRPLCLQALPMSRYSP
jgi:hypothetical protein